MARIFTLTAEGMALDNTVRGDLLVIQAGADRPFIVRRVEITQRTMDNATRFRSRLVRRSTADTTSSAGGTVAVSKAQKSSAAAGFTATMNRVAASPTLGTEAGVLGIGAQSLPNGVLYLPTPDELWMFCGTADYFCVEMPAIHGVTSTTVTFDVLAVLEEFC